MTHIKLKKILKEWEGESGDTPKTDAMSGDGWSGDAECVYADDCRSLEKVGNELAKAASDFLKFNSFENEKLTQAIQNWNNFKKI